LDWWLPVQKLFVFFDEIYPETARFVKTTSVPTGNAQKRLSAWQEATCKNVKCEFGILQYKFQILCHSFEKWDEKHINETVMTCILLHNMMVQECIDGDSDPSETFCGVYDPDADEHSNNQQNGAVTNHDDDDSNCFDDDAAQHICCIEAKVYHQTQIIESHRTADCLAYFRA